MAVLLCLILTASQGHAATFGRVSGKVTDSTGNPLMGVTIVLAGAAIGDAGVLQAPVEHAFTNAHGDFTIERVAPGWYSLQAIAPTRLPAFRSRILVRSGQTAEETLTLGDIFAHIGLQNAQPDFQAWGSEWKWILRTSASTRPVLRYRKTETSRQQAQKRAPLPSQRLVAMIPGARDEGSLPSDLGTGAIVAYFRPLDENSDVLVAGSVSDGATNGSSLMTSYRRNMLEKDSQEFSMVVHELRLGNGLPAGAPGNNADQMNSRAMVLRYTQTRQLSNALTLTTGMEVRYLNSVRDASTAQPQVELAYTLNPDTVLTLSYGMMDSDRSPALLDRVGTLNTFPRISMQNDRPRMENDSHAEFRVERKLGSRSRIEIATYHDAFRDVAVWSIGGLQNLDNPAAQGSILFQPGGDRAVLNAGRYSSSGVRAAYERKLGSHAGVGIMYSSGDALGIEAGDGFAPVAAFTPGDLPKRLHTVFTQSVSGKVSVYIPGLKTQIVTSYGWLPSGRVTLVDPYGQDRMDLQPFLGVQIRQPLPKIDILPVRIVALADFRNLLGQGSIAMVRSNGIPISLTPCYRSIRGGFAVQF